AALRCLAASMKTCRLARAASCPMNSEKPEGRSETSRPSSRPAEASVKSVMRASLSSQANDCNGPHSRTQLPQPQPDELFRRRVLAFPCDDPRQRSRGLGVAVAEIDQRRDRVRDIASGDAFAQRGLQPDDPRIDGAARRRFALELGNKALGKL